MPVVESPLQQAWDEVADANQVTITFDGVDAKRQAAAEMAAFGAGLKKRRIKITPGIVVAGCLVVGVLVSVSAIWLVGSLLGVDDGRTVKYGATSVVLASAAVLQLVLQRRQNAKAFRDSDPPAKVTFADRFVLRVTPSGFSIEGRTLPTRSWPLAAVERLEGERRLTILLRDGAREELACTLAATSQHADLAARLNGALAGMMSSVAGYRGE